MPRGECAPPGQATDLVGATPLVDVILPVRNYARYLAQSVSSVLDQSERRLRLIAIDYGSSDETPGMLAGFAARDPRVDVRRIDTASLVDALNAGLAAATAPFIARQDADDISFPDRFQRQLAAFATDSRIVAVSGSCFHIDAGGERTGSRFAPCDPEAADCRAVPAVEPYLLQPFLMVRRSAFEAVAGYRCGFVTFAEDSDLYWRLSRIGRFMNLAEPLGLMRLHAGSITSRSIWSGRVLAIFSQLAALSHKRVCSGEGDLEPDPGWLERMRSAGTLEAMLAIAAHGLSPEERDHLTVAAAVKLLELCNSRSLTPERSDCLFVRRVYSALPSAQLRGRSVAGWAYRTMLVRLVRQGEHALALALMKPALVGRIAALRLM